MKNITIYTDGSCHGNPGPGGWGAVLIYKNVEKELSGAKENTTNNQMELTAAIEALKALNQPCTVKLHTDSAYLCRAFCDGWIYNWEKKNWITSAKKPVENVALWKELLELSRYHKIEWIKVTGHSDCELNNRCDRIANAAANTLKKKKKKKKQS